MARDGVFTKIIYDAQGVVAKEIDRMPMIIGPAAYAIEEEYVFSWNGVAMSLINGGNDAIEAKLKPTTDSKISADSGLKLFLDTKYYGIKEMTTANFAAEATIAFASYNGTTTPTATLPALSSLYIIDAGLDASHFTGTASDGDLIVEGAETSTDFDTLLPLLFTGATCKVDDGYYKVITIGSDSFTLEGASTAELTSIAAYYDCTGANFTEYGAAMIRSPRIYATVNVNLTGLVGTRTISGIGQLNDLFGAAAVVNPNSLLPYNAGLALMASGGTSAIKIYMMETSAASTALAVSNSTAAHAIAMEKISGTDAYYIVPVTTSDAVLSLYAAHVVALSSTDSKKERRLYCAKRIFNEGAILSGYETPGNDLYGKAYIEVTGAKPDVDVDIASGKPGSFNSERVTLMPYYAFIGDVLIKGSEVASIVAGYRSGLSEGYVTTLDNLPLITSVPSLDYYSLAQLEELKDSGWYMLVQDKAGSAPYCYHQKTTSQDVLEKQEESLVIAVDAVAMALRATLRPFIAKGLANRISGSNPDSAITLRYINKVKAGSLGIVNLFVNKKEIFAGLKIVGLAVNSTNSDQVDVKFEVSHYYPANRINIALHIV